MSQFKQLHSSKITRPSLLTYASMPPPGEQGQEQSTPPPASYGYPPQAPQPQMTPPPGMMPPRKRTRRKWAIGCGAVVVLVILIAVIAIAASAGSGTHPTTVQEATQPPDTGATAMAGNTPVTQQSVPTNAPQASGGPYKVGDTVGTADGFDITVNKVTTSQGNEFETPPQGDQYLIVDVSTKNMTGQVQNMNALDFTLTDSTGQQMNWTVATGLPDMHPYPLGALQPGATSRGALVYEVPTGNHPYTLSFALDQFSGTQTSWAIHS